MGVCSIYTHKQTHTHTLGSHCIVQKRRILQDFYYIYINAKSIKKVNFFIDFSFSLTRSRWAKEVLRFRLGVVMRVRGLRIPSHSHSHSYTYTYTQRETEYGISCHWSQGSGNAEMLLTCHRSQKKSAHALQEIKFVRSPRSHLIRASQHLVDFNQLAIRDHPKVCNQSLNINF